MAGPCTHVHTPVQWSAHADAVHEAPLILNLSLDSIRVFFSGWVQGHLSFLALQGWGDLSSEGCGDRRLQDSQHLLEHYSDLM